MLRQAGTGCVVYADLVSAQEGVPMSGVMHVLISVQDHAYGAAQNVCRHGGRSIPRHAAGLLASKPSSNTLDMAHHLVMWNAQNMCNGLLML